MTTPAAKLHRHVSEKASRFTESVIREMTREALKYGAVNLSQGFPDFPAPEDIKTRAMEAIDGDVNQYAITWGARDFREAIARKTEWYLGLSIDPETEITVTCGSTEGMIAAMMACVDPGEEVVVFEPFYENYGPDAILSGARPVRVPLDRGGLDVDRLTRAFGPRTRAIVLNTPNNPTGVVLTRAEIEAVAELCIRHDALCVTDEIYEHILYEGRHIPVATIDGMRDRTVTISGFSKTFSVTGWRVGTIVAPAALTPAIRKVHDFLTVGAPAPLQEACAVGLERLGAGYYESLAAEYRERRDVLHAALVAAGFRCDAPAGAYYILADFGGLSDLDDGAFSRWLAREVGVAPVPGSSFYDPPAQGRTKVRFAFCKRLETLEAASVRLRALAAG